MRTEVEISDLIRQLQFGANDDIIDTTIRAGLISILEWVLSSNDEDGLKRITRMKDLVIKAIEHTEHFEEGRLNLLYSPAPTSCNYCTQKISVGDPVITIPASLEEVNRQYLLVVTTMKNIEGAPGAAIRIPPTPLHFCSYSCLFNWITTVCEWNGVDDGLMLAGKEQQMKRGIAEGPNDNRL